MSESVTVGIDIGTGSVKAIAADADGHVVARARVPHELRVPMPDRFEHDANVAWREGPVRALAEVGHGLDVAGVSVAAMIPSLTAVDAAGVPITPGLLYGDERGRDPQRTGPNERGELLSFCRWAASVAPDAAGYWPAQAVANHALSGEAILDSTTAFTAVPLFDGVQWDEALARDIVGGVQRLPRVAPSAFEVARVGDAALAAGCIDAFAEQLVAGADDVGDVLVMFGTTLIVWVVLADPVEVDGYYCVPHTTPGRWLFGGPSNAGGLFVDWVTRALATGPDEPPDPARVPVWAPYPRGERVPFADPDRRAQLVGLDLTHDAAGIRRAAHEAGGFVVRRMIDACGATPNRIVATGGGVRSRPWVQAVADATALPVDVVAVPEGGALGSAWIARLAAGLEPDASMNEGRRWARTDHRQDPDPTWAPATQSRYPHFLTL